MNLIRTIAQILILAKWVAEFWLSRLNESHVRRQASVPEPLRGLLDPETFARSRQYTLAKGRFSQIEITWRLVATWILLFSGVLPWAFRNFIQGLGESIWAMAVFLFGTGLVLSLTEWPFAWYAQFRLEASFGFNTATTRTWWTDRLKGVALAVVLGYPLLVLVLGLVDWMGQWWWLWAWVTVMAFELLMVALAPWFILPLFNRFTPLPEGTLRAQLLAVAERTGFRARSIQVMDGSKRSRHSNAFFTGLGRFRKIVLFDTLLQQLNETEMAAVLAHEIGHYRKRHIPKMMAWSAASLLGGFGALAWLMQTSSFSEAFGFAPGKPAPVFLLSGLLASTVTYWLAPVTNFWSRRFEYEADAFAVRTMGGRDSLVGALRKLHKENLSNLTPHPLYSRFTYSHPTLLEREQALARLG